MGTVLPIQPTQEEQPKCECGQPAIGQCTHCKKYFCRTDVSNVDFSSCNKCCESVDIIVNKVSKNEEDYDEFREETVLKTFEAKRIILDGQHWIRNSTIIGDVDDKILGETLEFYGTMVRLLEQELLNRKIKRDKAKIAAHPITYKSRGRVTSISTETKTTVRRKKDPMDALMALANSGQINPQKLMEMLQELVAKKNLGVDEKK